MKFSGLLLLGLLVIGASVQGMNLIKPPHQAFFSTAISLFKKMPLDEFKEEFVKHLKKELKNPESPTTQYFLKAQLINRPGALKWCEDCPFRPHELSLLIAYIKERNALISEKGIESVLDTFARCKVRSFLDLHMRYTSPWKNMLAGKPCEKKNCPIAECKFTFLDLKLGIMKPFFEKVGKSCLPPLNEAELFWQCDNLLYLDGRPLFYVKYNDTKRLCKLLKTLNQGPDKKMCRQVVQSYTGDVKGCCFFNVWKLLEEYGLPELAVQAIDDFFASKVPA